MGVLVGGAIGDALGAPFEGGPPNPSRVLPARGDVTDDTELTIATCEAPRDLVARVESMPTVRAVAEEYAGLVMSRG